MNRPPTEFTPVPAPAMHDFVRSVFEHAGVPTEKADFLSQLLVDNDLRGVFSHGTRQSPMSITFGKAN
jgi:L-2-hydroxycarboxylate dehydrogenase (NAD+)